jgi:putative ABC transport system permease protein
VRLHLRLIRLIGIIVPRSLRSDWRQEWEAELGNREAQLAAWERLDWRSRLDLFFRSLGAFRDALLLQPRRLEDEMIQDLRIGLRLLRSRPGFSVVAVLTLALGIGATTLIFSVVNAVLLRPLPFPNSDRIIRIEERHQQSPKPMNLTYASFIDLTQDTRTLEHVAGARFWTTNLADGGEPEQVSSMVVSASYFSVLGVRPVLGRDFLAEEDRPGKNDVVIMSHALWQRRYGGNPDLIGKTIKAGGNNVTVVGVMPPGFRFGYPFAGQYDLWAPLAPGGSLRNNRRSHLLGVIARVRRGVTIGQAQADLGRTAAAIQERSPGTDDPELSLSAVRLSDRIVTSLRPSLMVFLCAVGLLLMIACANVANLMLARSTAREREMAIRTALGAGRLRLVRQLLTESALLAALGGAAGLLLATWGVQLVATLNPADFPRINEANVDGRVLGFAFVVSMIIGVLFGLAPVIQLPGRSLHESLKEGGREAAGIGHGWLRKTLVVSEVALAVVLLIGAGLLINSFVRLIETDRGFEPANVWAIRLNLPFSKYSSEARQAAVLREMTERVSVVPGVRSAGLTSALPFTGGAATDFEIEGRPVEAGKEPLADIRSADPGYFETMRIPVRAGRAFLDSDSADAPLVIIINEELARRHWPGEDPLGRRVTMKDWGPPLTGEIVGVVGDVRADGLDTAIRPMIYWPTQQFPSIFNTVVIRTESDPVSVINTVKTQIWSVDPDQPLSRIQALEEVISGSIAPRRFNMLLLGAFAAIALVLAAVGIYGVISYAAALRTREIGVRMALGAQRTDVLGLVVKQGMTLTMTGVGAGLAAAFGLTRLMRELLFEVQAFDPLTFGGVALVLVLVALAACYVPARRSARLDPTVALRHE